MLIHVAVPVPGLDVLTYSVPHEMTPPPVGARVVVPLGARTVTGVVSAAGVPETSAEPKTIKSVLRVLDVDPFVPGEIVDLAQWAAEYYMAGPGEALSMVLPPNARGARADAHKTERIVSITAAGRLALGGAAPWTEKGEGDHSATTSALTLKQAAALELLVDRAGRKETMTLPELAALGVSTSTVARLAKTGLVALERRRVERDPFADGAAISPTPAANNGRSLTADQDRVLQRLLALAAGGGFRAALLHGVTGSGKTEVYLRLAAAVCASGRRVVVLVPEIALTPAVAGMFREAFGARVAVQHSGLADGERHDQWQRIRRGEVDVVVGTRSAVFAPVSGLGLLIVDEEHDASYKQEESPRYNARDVGIVRAMRAGALVVLGSATPSMETYYNAMSGRYEHLVLDRRIMGRPLADVTLIDMREVYATEGPDAVVSAALCQALAARLDQSEQTLVLLNRRGYATSVFCRQCAGTVGCPNCSVSLVVHGDGAARRARCHYCGYSTRVPSVCPVCAGAYMEQAGFGTERVEAEIVRLCPGARVARLDRDAIRRRGALASILSRFRDGEIDVLVGTQMIAKGHDFPRVTLVGVISADVGLGTADFRSAERTFQLLTQVAGRAGRGEQTGEAIVQTLYPDHYSIALACRQDYPAFYERELTFRQSMLYPPIVFLVNVVVRGKTFAQAMDDAAGLAQRLRRVEADAGALRVLGPAPAPLGKLRGDYRAQLLLKGTSRRSVRKALALALEGRPELRRRLTVDVDPLSVL